MKKLISVFFAILMVMAVMVPAFAAYGDYSNKSYKVCYNPTEEQPWDCGKINDVNATTCRVCGGTLDDEHSGVITNGEHDIPDNIGGSFIRCPECGWISGADETECQYCDASIVGCKKFYIEYGLVCPGCNKYIYRYAPDEFERCGGCGTLINEIEPTRYSSDPLDPDANWDERPVDGNKEPTFFEKLANAFANFFAKIAEFFKKIIDAIGSIFK